MGIGGEGGCEWLGLVELEMIGANRRVSWGDVGFRGLRGF